MKKIFLFLSLLVLNKFYSQFTFGNLVVLQAGDGNSVLAGSGNPIILREFNTSGIPTYSLPIPSTGTNALVIRGSATSEGYISKSSDGKQIVFGGYLQSLPNTSTASLNGTTPSNVNRGIGLADASGSYVLGAWSSVSSLAAGDIRGATASNSTNLWATSSSQGLTYYGNSSIASNVENGKTNLRAAHIFSNQLYISSQVSTGTPANPGIFSVGTNTPNSSGQTVNSVINTGTNSAPGQFYFNNSTTICYVADANNNAFGGIQKWINNAGVWTLTYTLPTGTAAIGAFGVVADFSGANPKVYATSTEGSNNRLIAINDIGVNSTATTLATASVNSIFRGLVFSPASSTCTAPIIVSVNNNSPSCSSQSLAFTSSVSGTAPFSYTWSGQGQFSSTVIANPTIVNSVSGNYTLSVSNGCGNTQTVIAYTVNPTPTLNVNAATICSGGSATLIANGANSYTWNTGSTNLMIIVNPTVTTNYTLNGSSAGCSASPITTTVTVTTSPTLSVNSATICSGKSATLTASGASNYTWSINSFSASIIVSPTTTTVYSVSASASGCTANLNGSGTVVVNPLPIVSFTIPQSVVCLSDGSFTLDGQPSGGIFSGTGIITGSFNPFAAGIGTYSLNYSFTASTGCSNNSGNTIVVSACLGIDKNINTKDFEFYPNPASNEVNLEFNSDIKTQIEIFSFLGQRLFSQNFSNEKIKIDLSELKNGIYFIKINSNDEIGIKKFVVEKNY